MDRGPEEPRAKRVEARLSSEDGGSCRLEPTLKGERFAIHLERMIAHEFDVLERTGWFGRRRDKEARLMSLLHDRR